MGTLLIGVGLGAGLQAIFAGAAYGPRARASFDKSRVQAADELGSLAAPGSSKDPSLPSDRKGARSQKVFREVVQTLSSRYVHELSKPKLWAKLSQCAAADLDPYTFYIDAAERQALRRLQAQKQNPGIRLARLHRTFDRGRPPGLASTGASDGLVSDGEVSDVVVSDVEAGSAAQQAGIEVGQRVLAVGGIAVSQLSSQAALDRALLAQPESAKVLTVLDRRNRALKLRWSAQAQRPAPALQERELPCGGKLCLYFKLRGFVPGVADNLRRARKRPRGRPLGGIVLDLRGNGGGELQEALKIADQFVDNGVLTRLRGRGGQLLRQEKATQAESDLATPLVILLDGRSASASELLTAALQDHRRAWVIGERSYGKGSVQDRVGFADGSYLQLTTARYFSPKDRPIDGYGVEPDMHLHRAHRHPPRPPRHPRYHRTRPRHHSGSQRPDLRASQSRSVAASGDRRELWREDSGVAAALAYLVSFRSRSPQIR